MYFGLEQSPDKKQGVWMGYNQNKDLYAQFGTPVLESVESDLVQEIKHTIEPPIPIFFDSFISYQASSSIDRLAWHIQYAIKQLVTLKKDTIAALSM